MASSGNKDLLQIFENFAGIDLKNSDLTRVPNYFPALQNFEYSNSNSIRGRKGRQGVGQRSAFLGTHTYRYFDKDSGKTLEEHIGINAQMYKLATESLTVTRTGGDSFFGWQNVVQATDNYRFTLYQGTAAAVVTATNNLDLGTGGAEAPVTMWDLYEYIDGLANFSCSKPTISARVNGNQTAKTINVDAGHTITAGDYLTLWDYAIPKLRTVWVTATTATSFTFASTDEVVQVKDNQIIGRGAVPAAWLELDSISGQLSSTSPQTLSFDYWKPIYCPQFSVVQSPANHPFASMWSYRASEGFTPPVFVDANNCCYIFYAQDMSDPLSTNITNPPRKYDGQNVYAMGCDSASPLTISSSASFTPIGAGTYKYFSRKMQIDHRENEILGKINFNEFGQSITLAAGDATDFDFTNAAAANFYNCKYGYKDTTEITTTTIKVDDGAGNPHSFDVGDFVTYFDSATLAFVRTQVTAVNRITAPYTITLADQITLISDNVPITCGALDIFYRTLNAGTEYYETLKIPAVSDGAAVTYTDTNIDSVLEGLVRYEQLPSGKEVFYYPEGRRDGTLPARFATLHQGLFAFAGNDLFPNSIFKDSYFRPEIINEAFGEFRVPSTIQGPLTAMIPDNFDRLIVTKETSIFSGSGDFESGAVNFTAIAEGDYGVAGPKGMGKAKGVIYGLGEAGLFKIDKGALLIEENELLTGAIDEVIDPRDLRRAIFFNHSRSKSLKIFIPSIYDAADRRHYSLDYFNGNKWFDLKYASTVMDPNGGSALYNKLSYHSNLFSGSYDGSGFSWKEIDATNARTHNYYDWTLPIPYRIFSSAIHKGTPKLDKSFAWFALYSMPLENEAELFTGFTLTLKTYRNFQSSTYHTNKNLVFSAVTDFVQEGKLLNGKMRALAFELTNVNAGECPLLTGWELLTDDEYELDSLSK